MKCHADGSKSEHTDDVASFSYTFELISVAVPEMKSPAPCVEKSKQAAEHFIGAMDESSGRVQDASTHKKRCCHGCCSLQS